MSLPAWLDIWAACSYSHCSFPWRHSAHWNAPGLPSAW